MGVREAGRQAYGGSGELVSTRNADDEAERMGRERRAVEVNRRMDGSMSGTGTGIDIGNGCELD